MPLDRIGSSVALKTRLREGVGESERSTNDIMGGDGSAADLVIYEQVKGREGTTEANVR